MLPLCTKIHNSRSVLYVVHTLVGGAWYMDIYACIHTTHVAHGTVMYGYQCTSYVRVYMHYMHADGSTTYGELRSLLEPV